MKFLVWFLCLVGLSQASWGYDIIELNSEIYRNILPAHFINHFGFEVPEGEKINPSDLGMPNKIVPMFPLYKTKWVGKKFIGVKIPGKYLTSKETISSSSSMATNSHFTYISPNLLQHIMGLSDENYQYITRQLYQYRVEDGVHLVPHFYNGDLYGIRSDYRVSYTNSQTIGFSLKFSSSDEKTVNFGDISNWGFVTKIGLPNANIGEEIGWNLGDNISNLFSGIDLIVDSNSALSIIETTLKFTPYLQSHLLEQFKDPSSIDILGNLHPARYMSNLNGINTQFKRLDMDRTIFDQEFRSAGEELNNHLEQEITWIKKVENSVNFTFIYDDLEANQLIQNLCDHAAASYQIPEDIWPRCRIAATPIPNAWAYPGGNIFFSAGLIGILSNLDSLLFIVGHEIAHVYARHTSKMVPVYNGFSIFANSIGITNSAFALTGGMGFLGKVTFLNWFWKVPLTDTLTGIPRKFVLLAAAARVTSYSRANEAQADRLGHPVSISIGARPEGLEQGWRDFSDYFKEYIPLEKNFWEKLLATHPSSESRLENIRRRNDQYEPFRGKYNQHRLPISLYTSYQKLHEVFRPLIQAYGSRLKAEIELAKSQKVRMQLSDAYLLQSMFSQAAQCVYHALGFHKI